MKIKNLINKNFNYRILIYDCDNKNRAYKKNKSCTKISTGEQKKIMKESNKSYQLKYLTSEFKKSSINFVKFSIIL